MTPTTTAQAAHRGGARRHRTAFAAAAFALVVAVLLPGTAHAAGAGTLTAGPVDNGRQLLYVNNPEPVFARDLANSGKSLMRMTIGAGSYRGVFEHRNLTGSTVNYGIFLYNPGNTTIRVTRTSHAFRAGSHTIGGAAMADLLNDTGDALLTLDPGRSGWILRSDRLGVSAANGQYLTGGADFSFSGGSLISHFLVFTGDADNLPGSYTYIGYVTEVREDVPQHRVDKGLSATSAARLDLSVTVNNNATGPVPITYTPGGFTACPAAAPITSSTWQTNFTHTRDATAVGSDMVSFTTPEGSTITPCVASPFGGGTPNLGNWFVLYEVNVRVTNNSGANRTFSLAMSRSTGNTFLARRNVGASAFDSLTVSATTGSVPWMTFTARPGTDTYTAYYMFGAPATGNISQTLRVTG